MFVIVCDLMWFNCRKQKKKNIFRPLLWRGSMETTRNKSRRFVHLLNSPTQLGITISSLTSSNSLVAKWLLVQVKLKRDKIHHFWDQGGNHSYFQGRHYQLPFCINKQEEKLIRIRSFCCARCSYWAWSLTLLLRTFMWCMRPALFYNEKLDLKLHLS